MFNLSIGLVILIVVNIILGSIDAMFNKKFDWRKLLVGVSKGAVVAVCAIAIYYVGYLNPDVVAIQVGDGVEVNLLTAVNTVIFTGFVLYGKQCIEKLSKIIIK